jgi:hypothetical protein
MAVTEKQHVDELVKSLRLMLEKLSWEERLDIFSDVKEGYCDHCGCNDPNCQCWNDE